MRPSLCYTLTALLLVCCLAEAKVVEINDDNWEQILQGEWLIKFFAPWCPACRSMTKQWDEFSSWDRDLGLEGVASVDITLSPGLSGRFFITSLPTIVHVKDGEFRYYEGERKKDNFISFVESDAWKGSEAFPWWKHPSSIPMTMMSFFFRTSMMLRNLHSTLTENYGIHSWMVYTGFALGTVAIGATLGLMLVCCIDFVLPMLLLRPDEHDPTIAQRKKDDDFGKCDEKDDDDLPFDDSEVNDKNVEVENSKEDNLRRRK